MKVEILATTYMRNMLPAFAYNYSTGIEDGSSVTDADALGEFAGRICYKSFDRPNAATAENETYLANIIRQGHFSVMEHASVTFLVRGVSRSLLTELTRHRHLSFSVVSQRYVNYEDTAPVIPPALTGNAEIPVQQAYAFSVEMYKGLVKRLTSDGLSRKAAREAARAVLPNAAPVDMVVTGNLRAWRDVLAKRHHVAADAEMQEFARRVLDGLRVVAPSSVQDIPEAPYGSEA
ncbi:FAD-dependent thymidylate synthase [Allostreptomyces psammosilenae]|uniref:Flavin-dependent thymidylate synthase n=1 Tax=Allostreptomyces psammosilenae TaxID=1892865 RepID=A0A852ZVW9_9ACTN|nr:FAD-dependent thymidylate synthase [Allostreptomyces psammosilenae]NYI06095.1 thymidylate synthase (FAD) [Allostreptomyces psammosilenae]